MGNLLQELIQNTALLLALALVYQHVERRLHHTPPIVDQLITGSLFGIFAIARVLLPYRVSPELVVDGCVVMVAMSGVFGGWLPALVAAGFASLPMLIVGDPNLLPEIGMSLIGAVGGALVNWRWRERVRQFGPLPFLIFGLCLLLVEVGWRLVFPATRTSLLGMLPILILINVFGVGALGTVLAYQFRYTRPGEELRKSEERYRRLFEESIDAIVITDLNGKILSVNPAACKLLGHPDPKRLIGTKVSDYYITVPDRDAFKKAIEREGFLRDYELALRRLGGAQIACQVSSIIRRDQAGKTTGYFNLVRDVTEQKHVQQLLETSEAHFRELFERAAFGIVLTDRQGHALESNPAFQKMVGYNADELRKMSFTAYTHPDDIERNWTFFQEMLSGQTDRYQIEKRFIRKDGKAIWARLAVSLVKGSDGQGDHVLTMSEDITEQRRVRDALLESERRFSRLAYNSPDTICIIDVQADQIVYFNRDDFLGYSREEVEQGIILDAIHPDEQAIAQEYRERLFKGDKGFERSIEYRLKRKDGEWEWFEHRTTILSTTADGAPAQILLTLTVITERKQTEQALLVSQNELMAQSASLTALNSIADAVHRSLDFQTVTNRALDSLMEYTGAPGASVLELGPKTEELNLISSRGMGNLTESLSLITSLNRLAATSQQIVSTDDLAQDKQADISLPSSKIDRRYRSAVCIPLVSQQETLGIISLFFEAVYQPTASERDTFLSIGNSIALAMANARQVARIEAEAGERKRAEEAEREQRALAEALTDITTALTGTLDLDEVLDRILGVAGQVIPHDSGSILLIEGDFARVARYRGYETAELIESVQNLRIPLDKPHVNHMLETGKPYFITDAQENPDWIKLEGQDWLRSNVGAPIILGDEVIGFISLDSKTPGFFDQDGAERLRTLADQAAVAIRNARLYDGERKQLQLARTLQSVGALLTSQMSLDDVFERIFDLLDRVLDYDSVGVHLLEEDTLQLIAGRGYPDMKATREAAKKVISRTVKERWADQSVLVISDTWADDRWVLDEDMSNRYIRSWIGAALRVKGQLIGTLNVDSATPNAYDESIADTVLAFANQAAVAIQNARLFAESQEHNRRLALLNELTLIGSTTLEMEELIQTLAAAVAKLIRAEGCYITLWDMEQRRVIPTAAHGPVPEQFVELVAEPGETTLTETVLNLGHALVIEDFDQSPYINRRLTEGYHPPALVALPLRTNERDLGALILGYCEQIPTFSDDYLTWVGQVANLVALAIDKAKAYADLEDRVEERTAELRELSIRLLELTRLKDEFVSNVSHELRTPITSIKLYHQLLRQRPERQTSYLERLERESDRLEFIVEDLLYLSRMEQGQLPFNSTSIDLNKLIDTYFLDRKLLIEQGGHRLKIDLVDELPLVKVDQMLIERVLNILIDNALNYTPQGEQITVSTDIDDEWVLLRVSDTGPGIPPDELTHLFERFFRGEASRRANVPGTGLGLAIAKEIVDRHEGRIDVSSIPDKGTTFSVRIPAVSKE